MGEPFQEKFYVSKMPSNSLEIKLITLEDFHP